MARELRASRQPMGVGHLFSDLAQMVKNARATSMMSHNLNLNRKQSKNWRRPIFGPRKRKHYSYSNRKNQNNQN